jgi:hypothetical protein
MTICHGENNIVPVLYFVPTFLAFLLCIAMMAQLRFAYQDERLEKITEMPLIIVGSTHCSSGDRIQNLS